VRVKRHAPAALRNREPILAVLARVLPPQGTVLEIASGSGEHARFFAEALPHVTWQPSDADAEARASIDAYRAEAGLPNLLGAVHLDARDAKWAVTRADAIVCINMIHIAPWAACAGLMRGAACVLPAEGILYLYGPFMRGGAHTAPSNASFDASLRASDPAWGVRDVDDVTREAEKNGLARAEIVTMPANNLSLVFRVAPRGAGPVQL
jgi:cyclopropane fatty-acyl-phospholipid synthase-like methyltransferase